MDIRGMAINDLFAPTVRSSLTWMGVPSDGVSRPTDSSNPGQLQTADSSMFNASSENGHSQAGPTDFQLLAKQVNNLKQQLVDSRYTVEFDTEPKAGRGWLNVVDKSTGQVVYEIPSEHIRAWIESGGQVSGLSIDSVR